MWALQAAQAGQPLLTTRRSCANIDALVEDHDAVIPQRIESRDVAPFNAAPHRRPRATTAQLQFGVSARPQARSRFDQRRAATEVDQDYFLTGT